MREMPKATGFHLAGARRGRLSRAERIREQTLLQVLSETMRRKSGER
jgi:hypothetical protein